jgi:hypothetical protein
VASLPYDWERRTISFTDRRPLPGPSVCKSYSERKAGDSE